MAKGIDNPPRRLPAEEEIEDAEFYDIQGNLPALTFVQKNAGNPTPSTEPKKIESTAEQIANLRQAIQEIDPLAKQGKQGAEEALLQKEEELRGKENELRIAEAAAYKERRIGELRAQIVIAEEEAKKSSVEAETRLLALEQQLREVESGSSNQAPEPAQEPEFNSEREPVPLAALTDKELENTNFNTPHEAREGLRKIVGHTETHQRHKSLKQDIDVAQSKYFAALRAYQKSRSGTSLVTESFLGEETLFGEKLPDDVRKLWQEWIDARALLWKDQAVTAEVRLRNNPQERSVDARPGLDNYRGKFTQEEVMARYERMSMVKATILGREEAEQAVRLEGLSEREKGRFDRMLDRYKALPPGTRIVATAALVTGVAAGATSIAAGSLLAGGILLVTGGVSTAGRLMTERLRGKGKTKTAAVFGALFSIPAAAGVLAEYAVKLEHGALGSKKKAERTLAKTQGFGEIKDVKDFKNIADTRRAAVRTQETIERQGRQARMLGSVLGGVAVGQLFSNGAEAPDSSTPEVDAAAADRLSESLKKGDVQSGVVSPPVPDEAPITQNSTDAAPTTPEPVKVEAPKITESLEIKGDINNADRLFGHFKDDLLKEHPELANNPAIKALADHGKTQDDLTRWLGFQDSDGTSVVVHEGDKVVFENGEVIFKPMNGEPHTLVDSKGELHKFDLTKVPTTEAPAPIEPVVKVVEQPVPVAVPTASVPPPTPVTAEAAAPQPIPTPAEPIAPAVEDAPIPGPEENTTPATSEFIPSSSGDLDTLSSQTGAIDTTPGAGGETVSAPAAEMSTSGNLEDLPQGSPEPQPQSGLNNIHNVEVVPERADAYVWQGSGSQDRYPFAFGGTTEQASVIAKDFVSAQHPANMLFVTEKRNLLGFVSERYVSAWISDAQGSVSLIERLVGADGKPWPLPNKDQFISKLPA